MVCCNFWLPRPARGKEVRFLSLDQLLRQHLQSMSEVLSPQQRPGGFGEFARLATAYIWTMDTLVIPALAQAGWRGVRVD